jgi:hypothetical protein
MTITRRITTAATVALLASAGTAAAAEAPVVSSQQTLSAKTAPVTIAGTGIKKGQRLPSGARVIYRDVTLEGRQTVRLSLRAPAGKAIRGLAPAGRVGFTVVDKGDYAGRKQVRVRAFKDPNLAGEVTGRIYGLAR